MIGRVVEVAEDGHHLSLSRGFLVVEKAGEELARVPLDDIAVVIGNAHGLTYSNNLLLALAERGAGLVLCGPNHSPVAWLWPLEGHHTQAMRMAAQLSAPGPLAKQLWRMIVQSKIRQQAAALEILGKAGAGFDLLARRVRSGDPANVEAQAAKRYWPLLFGPDFRRDRKAGGVNALLNYGYTILRSGVGRAVVAAGLHPSIGIHHSNRYDAFCLVDDLMEPFRPLVDLIAARLASSGRIELTKEAKADLVGVLLLDMRTARGTTPLATCLDRLAQSLAQAYEEKRPLLDLPVSPMPVAALVAEDE